jgi:hypothetical protein
MTMAGRIVFLDYLRVVACFMVMVIHSCEPFYLAVEDGMTVTRIASRGDARMRRPSAADERERCERFRRGVFVCRGRARRRASRVPRRPIVRGPGVDRLMRGREAGGAG